MSRESDRREYLETREAALSFTDQLRATLDASKTYRIEVPEGDPAGQPAGEEMEGDVRQSAKEAG